MQSRAVREGSVGLMLIAGLGVFGGIFLWLKGLTPGSESYNIIAQFAQAPGIQSGGAVRFRGIRVGKIAKITPGANGVAVTIQMDDPNLIIPKDVAVEISQTGLIGEPVVEITPLSNAVINTSSIARALDSKCDRNLILCNNAQVNGQIGASFNELLRRATKLVELYNNPELLRNINSTVVKAGTAAEDVSKLSKSVSKLSTEFSSLPKSVESGLNNLSAKANTLTISLDRTSTKIGNTADKFSTTATQLNSTAAEYKVLATSINSLVAENRKTFSSSLNNFDKLSLDLRKTVAAINPAVVKLNSTVTKLNSDKLTKDLEATLSNANQTSLNLKNLSANLNDPKTLLMLQQTLDSARVTFQNTQKITADIDDLTGSPEFRSNLRNLVNGLGKLVSSAEQLEQQAKLAQSIEPLGKSLAYISKLPAPTSPTRKFDQNLTNPTFNRPTVSKAKPPVAPKSPVKIDLPQDTIFPDEFITTPNLDNTLEPIPLSIPTPTPKN